MDSTLQQLRAVSAATARLLIYLLVCSSGLFGKFSSTCGKDRPCPRNVSNFGGGPNLDTRIFVYLHEGYFVCIILSVCQIECSNFQQFHVSLQNWPQS